MFKRICLCLTVIGGLNWGLIGLFDFNLVQWIFGDMTVLARLIYSFVGLSSVCVIFETIYKNKHHHKQ